MKKIKILLLTLITTFGISTLTFADTDRASELVNYALNQKTFYSYNLAYAEVMRVTDASEQSQLLGQLGQISNDVWTDEIKSIYVDLKSMADTSSAKLYDSIQIKIDNSSLPQVDKDYLKTEVTSWGKNLVWTEDYSKAINALLNAWNIKDTLSVNEAENLINSIKNENNKEYLRNELNGLKQTMVGTRVAPINLRDKQTFTLQPYSFSKPKNIQLQLSEMYTGDRANAIITEENAYNKKPDAGEQWILMKFDLKYISGNDNEELSASDVIHTMGGFYTKDGKGIAISRTATFSKERQGQSIYDARIYPGSETTFWVGIPVKLGDEYPLIKIGTGYDDKNYKTIDTWFATDPK
jgi:hypothetical protein